MEDIFESSDDAFLPSSFTNEGVFLSALASLLRCSVPPMPEMSFLSISNLFRSVSESSLYPYFSSLVILPHICEMILMTCLVDQFGCYCLSIFRCYIKSVNQSQYYLLAKEDERREWSLGWSCLVWWNTFLLSIFLISEMGLFLILFFLF